MAEPTYTKYIYPDCVPLEISVESNTWQADPLWTGVAFAVALAAAALISGALAPVCVRRWRKKQVQDEDEAVMNQKGIPMHLRHTLSKEGNKSEARNKFGNNEVHPSPNKMKDTFSKEFHTDPNDKHSAEKATHTDSMAAILLQMSEEAALLDIASQDLKDITDLQRSLADEKSKAMGYVLKAMLKKIVTERKMDESEAKTFAKNSESRLQDSLRNIDEGQLLDEGTGGGFFVMKPSADSKGDNTGLNANYLQLLNSAFLAEEDAIEAGLKSIAASPAAADGPRLTEAEVEEHMAWFKAQMLNLEKKLAEETKRQTEALDVKCARRRELTEVNALRRKSHLEENADRKLARENIIAGLVQDGQLTKRQAEEILNEYNAKAAIQRQQADAEAARQEQELAHKLEQRRNSRMKRLEEQQQKAQFASLKQLALLFEITANQEESQKDPIKAIAAHVDLMRQHRDEKDVAIAELDTQESTELSKMFLELAQQTSVSSDNTFHNILRNSNGFSEKEVERLIMLHKQQMEEVQRTSAKNRKRANDKLAERLEQLKKAKEENRLRAAAEQVLLVQQQQLMVNKVLEMQVDLTEKACQRILMEHEKNMNALSAQMNLNQRRQQSLLEQKLAERKAKLALKKSQEEAARLSKAESLRKQLAAEIEAEEQRIRADHALALEELRKRLAEETRLAVLDQEERLSLAIGKLQVGQVRRKSILLKQDKLLAELQGQLADKLAKKKTSPTMADQLMQQHQNEVSRLTEQLETDKERQERMLQEKLERKKLLREQDIQQQMRAEAEKELGEQKARGAGKAATVLFGLLLEQKHKKAVEDLEGEIQADLRKQRDEMNEQFESDLKKALDEQGKNFLATVAAVSDLSTREINEAVQNAALSIKAKDTVVRKLAREMKAEVARAKSAYGGERRDPNADATESPGLRRAKTDLSKEKVPESRPKSAKARPGRSAFND